MKHNTEISGFFEKIGRKLKAFKKGRNQIISRKDNRRRFLFYTYTPNYTVLQVQDPHKTESIETVTMTYEKELGLFDPKSLIMITTNPRLDAVLPYDGRGASQMRAPRWND